MEVDNIQTQHTKFSRLEKTKIGQYPDENQGKELKRSNLGAGSGANLVGGGDSNRFRGWHNSSRIIRVSRASGGKDRHSKVWTSKGLRDRRVRLSVTTAIQFYDLQDRLGFDQPSKAVEWLIKAAADAINELPSLDGAFPETPNQLSDEKRVSDGVDQRFDSADIELDEQDPNFDPDPSPSQHFSLSKSACSSTSDTSKGSGLSLSRSDVRGNRVKARERARERTAKEKEKEGNLNPVSQNSSFTELLNSGINNMNSNNNNHNHQQNGALARQWPLTPMDYFNSAGFPGQIHLGNSIPPAMAMSINSPFNFSGENNHNQPEQMQHFPFLSDHLIPVGATSQGPNGDYNLNFTISSSGLAGFNRGTLQSNSPSPNSQFHFMNSSNAPPFFIGAMENHSHQFPPGLHLYGDGSSKHSDHKGKGKN